MMEKICKLKYISLFLASCIFCFVTANTAFSYVVKDQGRIYIVDQRGERWDVTEAKSIGFKPERFQ